MVLNQKMSATFITFTMSPFDPFFEEFDQKIKQFAEAGMVGKLIYLKRRVNKLYNEEVPALVLTMNDLGIGFLICLVPTALSAVVFFFEVSIPRIRSLARKLRDVLVAVYVVLVSIKLVKN